eukprot:TRINITY_DN6256_c0_g3_i1.p1 TRINITY_DN6256_c0_g3~~TRINITY_DN6256_c0_g3_i1.p1  ORF type:complete len:2140 (-),score=297.08 TRINITY_DN6256_c0_g3_i1:2992-9411(-)
METVRRRGAPLRCLAVQNAVGGVHRSSRPSVAAMPRTPPPPPPPPPPPDDELVFLSLHHLHSYDHHPAIAAALHALQHALASLRQLPQVPDATGHALLPLTYAQCAERYAHVPRSFLRDLVAHTPHRPSHPLAPATLLGTGRFAVAPHRRPRSARHDAAATRVLPMLRHAATRSTQPSLQPLSLRLLPRSYRRLKRLVGHHFPVFTTLFDHSARLIVTGSDDNLIKIWCAHTAFLQHTLRGHDSNIVELVMHPTKPQVISASSDTTLRVWDLTTGAALHVLDGGAKEVNAVQCSPCPDRPYLVSGGADGSVRLWNADHFDAGYIRIPTPNRPPSRSAATDSLRNTRAVATSATAPPSPLPGSTQPPSAALSTVAVSAAAVSAAAVSAAAVSAAAISAPPPAPLPHAATPPATTPHAPAPPEPSRNGAAHSMVSSTPTYEVLSVCFNAGATRLAVSGTDCVAHVYAIDKPHSENSLLPRVRLLTSLRGHSEFISQVLFSRNGSAIVTACRDGTARIWKRTKAKLPPARGKAASVEGMGSWSYKVLDCRSQIQADAPSMLSGAASGSACGSIVPRMRRAVFPVSVCAVLWSHDDRYVFTATSDAKIRIWYAATGQLARVLHAHEGEIFVMDCHPLNGRILLSGGYDGQIMLWDIETGAKLRSFSIADQPAPDPSECSLPVPVKAPKIIDGQFSADGLSFVVADTSGAINLFGIDSGEATALAPEEQFFAHDCAPFRRDAQQRAVDENTGVLLHLKPKGRLCDKELRPHPPELQPNTPYLFRSTSDAQHKLDNATQQPAMTFKSTSYARDPNCDALLKRAREFRENQEKEERRLLREARNTRRRMIIERERVALEKADGPLHIPLRDIEAPDSEYEDSDEDFDGDAYVSDDSDSSSSSSEEEEDEDAEERAHDDVNDEDHEIRPVRRKRRKVSTNESRKEVSEHLRPQSRRVLRKRSESSLKRRGGLVSREEDRMLASENTGFEVLTNVGHTDDSNADGSRDRKPRGDDNREQHEKQPDSNTVPEIDNVMKGSPRNNEETHSLRAAVLNLSSAPRLAGASSQTRKRRMRICSGNTASQATVTEPPSAEIERARERHRLSAVDYAADSHIEASRHERNHVIGAQSVSCYGRVNQTEAGGNVVSQAPLNPSFTSERVDTKLANEAVFKPIEDHEGDSASCFRPRPSILDPDSRSRTSHERNQSRSFVDRFPQRDIKIPQGQSAGKPDGNEKSLLSDFPARLTRRERRERTRNGSKDDELVDKFDDVVDIDEVAQRELEILESQRNQRSRKKRRRRHSPENNDQGVSSDDPDKRLHRGEAKRISGLRLRPTRRNSKSEDLMLSKERVAGASENDIRSLEASTWLRSTSTPYTYVPQVGDDVMYFPGGHVTAMEVSKSSGLDPLLDKADFKKKGLEVLDGNIFPKDQSPLRFQIIDIQFAFPTLLAPKGRNVGSRRGGKRQPDESAVKPKTKVVITLNLISTLRRRAGQSTAFVLSYFPVDAPEYVVLTSRVDAALNRTWKTSDRFRILFLNEKRAWQYYTGKVRSVKSTIRTTMWNSIEVEYDNESGREKENVDLVSPWELEPLDLLEGSKNIHYHHGSTLKASTVEPGLFPAIARELEVMKQSESDWRAQLLWLETTTSLASVPGYCANIPCPMDLNTVLVRLCTGYYRHYAAFCFDVSLLKNNAVRYHGSKSEAGRLADTAFSRIIDLAEKVRGQFTLSWTPFQSGNVTPLGTTVGQSTYRIAGPRPSQIELTAFNGVPSAHTPTMPTARQAPVSVTPRESVSGITTPASHHPEIISPTLFGAHNQRAWNSMLRFGNSQVQPSYHQSHPMPGMGLPPALPGMPLHGVSMRSAGRGPKVCSRGQGVRQVAPNGRRTIGSVQIGGGQGSSASFIATAGTYPTNSGTPPIGVALVTPQGSPRLQMGGAPRIVTNSTQSNLTQRHQMRLPMPNGSLPSPTVARPGCSPSFPIPSATDSMLETASKTGRNVASSLPEHLVHHGTAVGTGTSHTNVRSPVGLQSRATRAGSTAGEGGANSWARSMEGAGGMFHHQASTSDSHLPAPTHGRSQSPISPAPIGTDATHRTRGQRNQFATANRAGRYQEYSTLSMAAAESTMSCGGTEVAQHAATAESAAITPVSRARRTTS